MEMKCTNYSTQSAQIFTFDRNGQQILMETLPAGRNTIIRTKEKKPWMCLDEEGERMLMSWCWWELDEGLVEGQGQRPRQEEVKGQGQA